MNAEPADDNALATTIAATLLDSISKTLNNWSMIAALAVILIVGLKPSGLYDTAWLAASLVAAFAQLYFAARCAFDAAIFASLGGNSAQYEDFDRLLTRWKLRAASDTLRSPEERAQGALQLLRRQALSFCLQIVLLTAGLLVITISGL